MDNSSDASSHPTEDKILPATPSIKTGKPRVQKTKKHYSEYLVQGLMIFVSVSLGFLSQNMREDMNTRDKEMQYIKSYLRNLKVDSAELETAIEKNVFKLAMLDSILELSVKDLSKSEDRLNFYSLCFSIVSYYDVFRSNDATFLQLTNSDGLRTIKTEHAADSISKYASVVKGIYAAEILYAGATEAATNLAHEVLDYTILYDSSFYKNHWFTGKFIPFNTRDPHRLKVFLNKIYFERAATQNYLRDLHSLQPFLARFTKYLQTQYKLNSLE